MHVPYDLASIRQRVYTTEFFLHFYNKIEDKTVQCSKICDNQEYPKCPLAKDWLSKASHCKTYSYFKKWNLLTHVVERYPKNMSSEKNKMQSSVISILPWA